MTAAPAWRAIAERVLLVVLGVTLDTLSMPPGPAPALVFAADAPFLWLLWHRGGKRWWLWAYLFGFARVSFGLRWLSAIHSAFPLGPGMFLGLVYVAWGGAIRFAVRRGTSYLIVVPLTAVLEEMARTVFLGGMPWPARSLAFTAWQPFVGFASVFGAYGLSFLAAFGSAWVSGLPSLFRGAEVRRAVVAPWLVLGFVVLATAGIAAYRGNLRVRVVDDRIQAGETVVTAPVVVVQGNVPQSLKHSHDEDAPRRILETHTRLTTEALTATPRALVVVWPETMIPYPFVSADLAARFPEAFQSQQNVIGHLREASPPGTTDRYVVGAPYYFVGPRGPKARFDQHDTMDSVFFVDARLAPDAPVVPHPEIEGWRPPWEIPPGRHDKVVLVPGGEYTPLGDLIPPLRTFKDYLSPIPELTPGSKDVDPFLVDIQPPSENRGDNRNREVLFGTANCFEIAFPSFCRSWRRRGATVLVNAANYGWFGDSDMPAQILAIGRLRAAELGVSVVMAGNTGPTAIVDPAGRVRSQVSVGGKTQFVEGWLAGPVWSDDRVTGYARWGDWPWFVASALLLLWCLWPRRRRTGDPAAGSPPPGPLAAGPGATDGSDAR